MNSRTIMALSVVLLIVGCGGGPSYKASPITDLPSADAGPAAGDYLVQVEPYTLPEQQEKFFDTNFTDAGVIALQVLVRNQSNRDVEVRREDILLALPDGHRLSRISAHSAAVFVGEKTGQSFRFSFDPLDLLFGLNPIGRGSPVPDARRKNRSRGSRIGDYDAKEFDDVTLGPGGVASGFVFFKPPPGTSAFDQASLNVSFLHGGNNRATTVSRSIEGLGFPAIKADPEAISYIPRDQRGYRRCDSAEIPAQPWAGGWKARRSMANLIVSIADGKLSGRITTPQEVFKVTGTVDGKGRIMANVEHGTSVDKASLSGEFPKVRTHINKNRPGRYWPLADIVFQLCT